MEIEELKSFLAVVREQSISQAANALHLTQPTLSTRIRKLEEKLGFLLLDRNWKGITLTPEGHYFLPYAIKLLNELNNASTVITSYERYGLENFNNVSPDRKEHLTIGINAWLAPAFTNEIMRAISGIFPQQKFQFITRPTNNLKEMLHYGSIDIGIYYGNEREANLVEENLMYDELTLLCSKEEEGLVISDINEVAALDKPFLLFDNPALANNRTFYKEIFERLRVEKFQLVDDLSVMSSYVASNNGFTILPKSVITELYSSKIQVVELGDLLSPMEIKLSYGNHTIFKNIAKELYHELLAHCDKGVVAAG
ncbi:LysR family transcriptional regulator [Thalassobacillus devorans]|uniref:LysR family transcriptional regulator n=1 Tax=Thalassobacillus devorans TaxID=279813 RepID=UPI00048AB917|nr:LysR family transcriptional regulator [Thalassobacillus devorans]